MSQQNWQTQGWLRRFARTHPRTIALIWLAILVWIGFFHGLGQMHLLDETEPMFVEAARQMHVSGDWLTPTFNGAPRFDKPPLIYWLMAIGFRLFGVSPWAAKLAAAVPATILVTAIFYSLKWCQQNGPKPRPTDNPNSS
ncbi:glycosyltransferase family 39 protein, partial [filamentous cyanobacterium LEGE 11480]